MATRFQSKAIINRCFTINAFVAKRAVACVVVGQVGNRIIDVGTVSPNARIVIACDDTRFFTVDTDKIFRAIATVMADQVIASAIVLTWLREALVDIFITSA